MSRYPATRRTQLGLGLVGAVFFITVVALLTVALTRSVATTAAASALDIQRMQALLAAGTGAQLGAHAVLPPNGTPQCMSRVISLDDFNLPGCQASISCRFETVGARNYYTIQSDGQCMDGANIAAQRSIALRLAGN